MRSPKQSPPLTAIATAGLAVALAIASAGAAETAASRLDLRRQPPVTGDAQAGKALSAVCSACHGEAGRGVAPTFPNLAGQSATYLYVQLKTFKGGQRSDPIMGSMVLTLGDEDMRNLAAYFASLAPAPGAAAAHAQAQAGARLFSDGDPARGIPPCQGCHGAGGVGPQSGRDVAGARPRPPWATIPRLQGQSGVYVAKALGDFRSGARGETSNAAIMHGVATTLDDAEIQSLADYLEGK